MGKFVHEIENELTPSDLAEYLAYYKMQADDHKKATENKNKPKPTPKRR